MDAFSYLAVLFSIVLGLALQQVLEGLRALLLARGRVDAYAPPLIWAANLLLIIAQAWWAMFDLRDHATWSFAMYVAVLLQTVLLYMAASLVLPERGEGERIDLRAAYFAHSRAFFGLLVALGLSSMLKDVVINGRLPTGGNLLFHVVFITGGVAAALTRRPWFHLTNALFSAATLGVYVALLFSRL